MNCNRHLIRRYLSGGLDPDEKLGLMIHVDTCSKCWETIYQARKAENYSREYQKMPLNVPKAYFDVTRLV